MRTPIRWATAWLVLLASPALADELIIYPTKDQSTEQQAKDKAECHTWAVDQSSFDPMNPEKVEATIPDAPKSENGSDPGAVRGAVRGALVGAAAGAVAGDVGKGAGAGAAAGAVGGTLRKRSQKRQDVAAEEDVEAARRAAVAEARARYDRALSACLTGRGYTVQ